LSGPNTELDCVEDADVVAAPVGCVDNADENVELENVDPVVAVDAFWPFEKPDMPDLFSLPLLFANEKEEAMLAISVPP